MSRLHLARQDGARWNDATDAAAQWALTSPNQRVRTPNVPQLRVTGDLSLAVLVRYDGPNVSGAGNPHLVSKSVFGIANNSLTSGAYFGHWAIGGETQFTGLTEPLQVGEWAWIGFGREAGVERTVWMAAPTEVPTWELVDSRDDGDGGQMDTDTTPLDINPSTDNLPTAVARFVVSTDPVPMAGLKVADWRATDHMRAEAAGTAYVDAAGRTWTWTRTTDGTAWVPFDYLPQT